jgi:hypothetical protein
MISALSSCTGPIGWVLPRSCSWRSNPNSLLQMSRTSWSELIGFIIWPLGFVGNFTLLNRRLVRRDYCSVSSSLLSRLATDCLSCSIVPSWSFILTLWLSMISSSFMVLFTKPFIVLCWLDRRICWFVMMFYISVIYVVIAADIVWRMVSSRLCWIASVIIGTSVVTND